LFGSHQQRSEEITTTHLLLVVETCRLLHWLYDVTILQVLSAENTAITLLIIQSTCAASFDPLDHVSEEMSLMFVLILVLKHSAL